MRALVFDGTLRLDSTVEEPVAGANEALLRIRLAGICGTDLEIVRGYKGFTGVLGHEFVGEVIACGEDGWIGKRVCGEINVACGQCDRCRAGLRTHCSARTVVGIQRRQGAFADYLALPVSNLHAVPNRLPDDEAVFAEPLAAAFEILEQVEIRPDAHAIVLGDGKLGILCAQVLKLAGASVAVLGKHHSRRGWLRDLGIDAFGTEHYPAPGADVVVDATGSPAGLEQALQLVKPRGAIVLKSTTAARSSIDLASAVVNEVTIVGSRCGPFPLAIRALLEKTVQVRPLIAARYPLAEGLQAMEHAATPGMLKVLLDMSDGRETKRGQQA